MSGETVEEQQAPIVQAAIDLAAQIEEKIIWVLGIYPKLNMTMLQVGLGTGVSPKLWHPVLDGMIEKGIVRKYQVRPDSPSPTGRDQVYTVLELMPGENDPRT